MIKPLNDNLTIIYEEEKEKTTASGIIVTGSAANDKSKPAVAIVAGVGKDVKGDISVGDAVLWNRQSLGAFGNVIIVPESTILAVVETSEVK